MREHDADEALPRVPDETGVVAEEESDRPPPDDVDHAISPREEQQDHGILPRRKENEQIALLLTRHARRPPRMAELHRRTNSTPAREGTVQIL